jgi:hypothetical protein
MGGHFLPIQWELRLGNVKGNDVASMDQIGRPSARTAWYVCFAAAKDPEVATPGYPHLDVHLSGEANRSPLAMLDMTAVDGDTLSYVVRISSSG